MLGPIVLAVAAVVVAGVAILAATGRMRRNRVAGIRIPSLSASDAAWRRGHRAAVPPTVAAAAICIVIAIAALVDPALDLAGSIVETVVLLLGVLAGTALATRAVREHSP